MKRLFTIFIALVVSSSISASAQQAETIRNVEIGTNPLQGNWFVQLGAGAIYFNGNFTSDMQFGRQIAPSADLNVGKWFTPTFGARLGVHGLYLNTHNSTISSHSTINELNDGTYDQRFYNTNIHADALFNVTNMVCGYRADRVYEFVPYAGIGLMQGYKGNNWTDIAFDFGILNNFNISERFGLYIDVAAVTFKNEYSGRGVTRDFTISATAGLSYKFGKCGWAAPVPVVVSTGISQADFDNVKNANASQQDEINKLKDDLENAQTEMQNKLKASGFPAPELLVTFKIGSAELDNLTLVNLGKYAKSIKDATEAGNEISFTLTGYADKFTGSDSFNNKLSQERADAVKSVLVDDFGVAEDKLDVKFEGGVDNMFYDDRKLSRSVILSPNN